MSSTRQIPSIFGYPEDADSVSNSTSASPEAHDPVDDLFETDESMDNLFKEPAQAKSRAADSRPVKDVATKTPTGARKLTDLAYATLKKNVHLLWEAPAMPENMLLPLCRLVTSADQLESLEKSNPLLQGQLGDCWLKFMKRDILGWYKMLVAVQKDKSKKLTEADIAFNATHRTYRRLQQRMVHEEEKAIKQLQAARVKEEAARDAKQTRVVAIPLKKGRLAGKYAGVSDGLGQSQSADGSLRFAGGSRTKANTGKGALLKMQRQCNEERLQRRGPLATPLHLRKPAAQAAPKPDARFSPPQTSYTPRKERTGVAYSEANTRPVPTPKIAPSTKIEPQQTAVKRKADDADLEAAILAKRNRVGVFEDKTGPYAGMRVRRLAARKPPQVLIMKKPTPKRVV
ncbi:hypothetical protein BT63DRAFT_90485 [Microthyrium microscopicum]|uniref:Elongin-A n=1 Tax=Microthyrium microscopicum TaxID=703497 RepID=A0A6A6TYT1_9PEZI|nr:hypothetical protein BT63DRAFT_90485 [Microthyrium microscopicum]